MENYAGSSTLLIFDAASASFIVGISVLWLLGDFLDSWVKKKTMREPDAVISFPSLICPSGTSTRCFVATLIVEDLRGQGGRWGQVPK